MPRRLLPHADGGATAKHRRRLLPDRVDDPADDRHARDLGGFWTYRTNEDLKRYNGDGLGGVLGIVIYLLISIVLMFTIPNEIEKMYQRDGRQSPISTVWGLWFLLPIIGNIIWYVKVQRVLNEFWASKGSPQA